MSLSDPARDFLAGFFSMGKNSCVTSHEPHATLSRHRAAYDECKDAGLVTEEPFNKFGSITIRPTEEGSRIARERSQELVAALLASPADREGRA